MYELEFLRKLGGLIILIEVGNHDMQVLGLSPHHEHMKYVFRRQEISEGIGPEIFDAHYNSNINLQIIVSHIIWMSLLVYLTCKKPSKNYM